MALRHFKPLETLVATFPIYVYMAPFTSQRNLVAHFKEKESKRCVVKI